MDIVLLYMRVFLVGGFICMLGQILINLTKMTAARILTLFLMIGLVLETIGWYQPIADFGKAGATIPILGFGSALAKGAIKTTLEQGLIGAITGGFESVAGGVAWVVFLAFVLSFVARSKTKT